MHTRQSDAMRCHAMRCDTIRCEVMRRDETRWVEMRRDETRWDEMRRDETRWDETTRRDATRHAMIRYDTVQYNLTQYTVYHTIQRNSCMCVHVHTQTQLYTCLLSYFVASFCLPNSLSLCIHVNADVHAHMDARRMCVWLEVWSARRGGGLPAEGLVELDVGAWRLRSRYL